ncbi:peptide ABC transporter permease [Frondihabitans sucicola]|uniref:Peptide ABC transporter permease n=1 Tax=Frondihabitans sucicola TaxID=1268041 RepID=A0ABN6Y5Q6_9MICO|nr:ABC transporter permease [Frondihabitans sucicola]BDZ51320.1 peptide ABC transporter permease [Frondihabitans sucicola]
MTATIPGSAAPAVDSLQADASEAAPGGSRFRSLLRRPSFIVSVLIVVWWVVAAIGWHLVGLQPYAKTGELLASPTWAHPFGTDNLGRDMFARVVAGAGPALLIGPFGALLATIIGGALGLVAGYYRGVVDTLMMRFFDVLLALPSLIFLVVLVGAFGIGPGALILIVGILFAPGIARIIRAATLVEMGKSYVTAAKLQGERDVRILFRELLPNVLPNLVIQATLSLAAAVFITASLSFLGLGSQPPSADWGLAINENRVYLQTAWWTVVFPAVGVASLVVAANLIADNIREVSR